MLANRPEDEVILCSARTSIDSERADLLKATLKQNIDWQYLMKTARRHGLMPLLYKNLSAVVPEMVPETVMKTLEEQYQANNKRNLFLTGELIKLLHMFESSDVYAIPFKGPALAASVYGDVALRQFSDLDILVRKEDVMKTWEIMISLGYVPEVRFKDMQIKALIKYQYELHFTHSKSNIFVGLHWELVPRYLNCPLVSEYLWKNTKPVIGGPGLPIIQPEYLLLMLCIHGTKDFWRQLIWVCDVAELIHVHKEMDWDFVLNLANNIGCQRMLFLGLYLAKDILDISVPADIVKTIESDHVIKKLAAHVEKGLFQENDKLPGTENVLFYLMSKERLRDKIRFSVRMVNNISQSDIVILQVPPPFFFIYYLVRPIRLVTKYLLRF